MSEPLVNTVVDALLTVDEYGIIQSFNASAETLFGYRAEQVLGQPLNLLLPIESNLSDGLAVLAARGRVTAKCQDGSTIDVALGVSEFRLHEACYFTVIVGNQNEVQRARQALELSEKRLRLAVEASGIGIWDFDLRTRTRNWSDQGKAIYGLAPHELLDYQRQLELIYPDDRELVDNAVVAYRDQGTARRLDVEHRIVCPDGVLRWVAVHGEAIYDGGARPVRLIGTITDVTERKRADAERERLLETAQRAREQAEKAADRIVRQQRVTAELTAALTREQVVQVVLNEGAAALEAAFMSVRLVSDDGAWLEAIGTRGLTTETDPLYQRLALSAAMPPTDALRTGKPIWLESKHAYIARYPHLASEIERLGLGAVCVIPLTLAGRVAGTLGINFGSDFEFDAEEQEFLLTLAWQCAQALERARLYAQAQTAIRVRDEFLAVASHEVRTPLTSIVGYAQLLQKRARDEEGFDERNRRAINTLVEQATRLQLMIDTLLNVSRLEKGQLTIVRRRLDLSALVRRIVDEIQPTLETHVIVLQGAGAPLFIQGDELRLDQVLQNLIRNAIKYSPDAGVVEINVTHDDRRVSLAISDHGIGIPASAQPELFQQFYRAPNAEQQQISGMGIGLFVAREIVQLHGGEITVESEQGKGSTFTVRLPLSAGESTNDASDPAQRINE